MRDTASALWVSEEAFATTLVTMVLDRFTKRDTDRVEVLTWRPETLWLEISDEWCQPLAENFHKLMAAIAIITSDAFFDDEADFNQLCLALDGDPDGALADAEQCAWGITEALLLSPPARGQEDVFSDEVRSYVGWACTQAALLRPPDVLRLGLFDRDHWEAVRYDWADDPEMFVGIVGAQEEKAKHIDAMVRQRLRALLDQLGSIRLDHGDPRPIVSRLLQRLQAREEQRTT